MHMYRKATNGKEIAAMPEIAVSSWLDRRLDV
jgi:hypothetical protein